MSAKKLLNRDREVATLQTCYQNSTAELVSITGRRRVGKTYLVRELFQGRIDFELTGTQNGTLQEQLLNFSYSLGRAKEEAERPEPPADWQHAFFELENYFRSLEEAKRKLVFLDELPWLAAGDPKFLRSFSHFWNSYAGWANVMVVICGSATSWIINKVVRDRGGLHNRITKRIHLDPFNLQETKHYLDARKLNYTPYAVAEIYMATGGIPFYLDGLLPGLSVAQNIDQLCFAKSGLLYDEFRDLYPALFDGGERHMTIVRTLARHPFGLTRKRIVADSELTNGGTLTKLLEELEFSGFIKGLRHFGKRKAGKVYRLTDSYSLFYLRFIEPAKETDAGSWAAISRSQAYVSWAGYAFENIGFLHLSQIRKALGIAGVQTATTAYYTPPKGELPGLQIDMLIERADKVINLCEFKFYREEFSVTPVYGREMERRQALFRRHTKTKAVLFTTLVTTFGVVKGNAGDAVQSVVTLEDLFT